MPNKKILFLGNFYLSETNIRQLFKSLNILVFKPEFIRDFEKIKKSFSYKNYSPKKYEMIIVGQVPHKTNGTGYGRSLVSDVCILDSEVPVYVCRDEIGRLKATKQGVSKVLEKHFQSRFIENLAN